MNVKEYKERSLKYFDEGNYDGAIADLNEVIRLEPDNHSAYYMRGGAYAFKENKTLAISDLEMAVKLDPQNKDYRERLEELKNIKTPYSFKTYSLKGFLIRIIIGVVIGGGLGALVSILNYNALAVGIIPGLFIGIGFGYFFGNIKTNIKMSINQAKEKFQEYDGFSIKGFFIAIVVGVLALLLHLILTFIKSPFVTIYRLITGNFDFGL